MLALVYLVGVVVQQQKVLGLLHAKVGRFL
jgi:hypothetical protein